MDLAEINQEKNQKEVNQSQESIFRDQLNILHKNLLVSIPSNFICALVVFIGLYQVEKTNLALAWFLAIIGISLFRLAAYYYYYRHPQVESRHFYIFLFGLVLSASLWGVVDSILMPENDLLVQMLVIVIVAGVTAGGIQTLNASLIASLIYISLIILPLCIWLLQQKNQNYLLLFITMAVYLIFMLITSVRSYKLLIKNLNLVYENLALIDNLSESNKKLLQSYKVLEQNEHEKTIINSMNDMLQTCHHSNEAYKIILFTAQRLFNKISGGLVILNPANQLLETVGQWGENRFLKEEFHINDCWALRKGHTYLVENPKTEILCYHFNSLPGASLCLPLIIQNGIEGLLILHASDKNNIENYYVEPVTSFCEVIQLTLTNIKLSETLYEQTIHDPLTGLYNRRCMDDTLTRELQRAMRENKTFCVAMLDIDFFKLYNDENGHEAGDIILKHIATILNANFRESDIACRFGGEEFLIVLINTNLSKACEKLERIREIIKKEEVKFQGRLLPPITVSIGVAEAPRQGKTVNEIIDAADQALYVAKQAGRDRIEKLTDVVYE